MPGFCSYMYLKDAGEQQSDQSLPEAVDLRG